MVTVLLSLSLWAQGPIATARAVVTPPRIDGRLTDPLLMTATPVTGFVQRELHEGAPVTERTEVRILTHGQAPYVGAWLYDRDPAGIVAGEKVRDGDISKSDYFGILLDTYHDRQNGFVFTTTPAGIEYDAQVVNEGEGGGIQLPGQTRTMAGSLGGFNLNWDGTWTVATSVDSAGWYAEFRIPFTTLRRSKWTNSARISRVFRCSSRRSVRSSSKTPASFPPAHPRPSICFSPAASASTPSASRSRSWAVAGSPGEWAASRWARCRSSRTEPPRKRRWRTLWCGCSASWPPARALASSPCSAWPRRKLETGTACTASTAASASATRGRSIGGARHRPRPAPTATRRRTARASGTRPVPGPTSRGSSRWGETLIPRWDF